MEQAVTNPERDILVRFIDQTMDLLERSQQLSGLESALVEASAGSGRIALISGEAGIGKTSLVRRFASRQPANVRVLWGTCDLLFTPNPLGPLLDMLPNMVGKAGSLLEADAPRSAVFNAVLDELHRTTTIIVFEDMHWADEATLDLVRFLGRRITTTRSLMILTYRDDELGFHHPLRIILGDLGSSVTTHRIQLSPLSKQAVEVLVAGRQLDAAALHQQTGGNPFFVTEVLASPASGIPPTIRDAVLARIARLSPTGRALVETAAVIGQHVEVWLLNDIAGNAIGALDECLASGVLLTENEVLVFRHELARQTILASLSPQRKYSLHQRVLGVFRAMPVKPSELARLAHHAEAANDELAVLEFAPPAAQHASATGSHREARILYALVLRYAGTLPLAEQARLLHAYSRECNLTENQEQAIEAVQQALAIWRRLDDPLQQGDMLAYLTIYMRNSGRNQDAERASREAIELLSALPPSRELSLAYRAQATLRIANRDTRPAIEWAQKAIELGEQYQDENVVVMAHVVIGAATLFQDFEKGRKYLEQRLAIGHQSGNEAQVANLYAYIGSSCAEIYQFHWALKYLSEGSAYSAERGMDIFSRFINSWLAKTQLHLGHWEVANELLGFLAQNPPTSAITRIPFLAATGLLRIRRGDPGAVDVLDEAMQLAELTGCLPHIGAVRAARAEAAWLAGDLEFYSPRSERCI